LELELKLGSKEKEEKIVGFQVGILPIFQTSLRKT